MVQEFKDFVSRGNVIELAVAWVLFLVIRTYNRTKRAEEEEEEEAPAPAPSEEVVPLLTEIRDSLRRGSS